MSRARADATYLPPRQQAGHVLDALRNFDAHLWMLHLQQVGEGAKDSDEFAIRDGEPITYKQRRDELQEKRERVVQEAGAKIMNVVGMLAAEALEAEEALAAEREAQADAPPAE